MAIDVAGMITENRSLSGTGFGICTAAIGYLAGTVVGENQFKKASDLEKKLE